MASPSTRAAVPTVIGVAPATIFSPIVKVVPVVAATAPLLSAMRIALPLPAVLMLELAL